MEQALPDTKLRLLLEACQRAIAEARDNESPAVQKLVPELERFCAEVEAELAEAGRRSAK